MKKIAAFLMVIILTASIFTGCSKTSQTPQSEYKKYQDSFYDTFDTIIMVVGYAKTQEEFNSYMDKIHKRYQELDKLFDIYNSYDGLNNAKTINDNAGIKPVKVDKQLVDIIEFSKEWCKRTGGLKNIALGSVLSIWHDYREEGISDPDNAELPPMKDLQEAMKHTDIDKVIVDEKNSTVYLEDKGMSLDLGGIAKGYSTEIVAKEMMAAGFTSGIINAGGNVRILGKPLDGIRERWGVGIQDPNKSIVSDDGNTLDTVFLNNASVVDSGDYQRYYVVGDKVYHHIIDPTTLMPANYFHQVTIVTQDSGMADFLSSAVFMLPYDKGRALVESLPGVEAMWVMMDGTVKVTDGMKKILKSCGASGAKAK
ncbi:MAG: FAD:protein FMN transferase [Bacillota bacterium]|nr:FAD:protein FMN transferase [Bacillota bacterium]